MRDPSLDDLNNVWPALGDLRGQLADALGRIDALENAGARLIATLRETAAGEESVCRTGLASDERLAVAEALAEAFTAFADAITGPEPEPDPAEYDPGPEVDDEGGMSEYRYHEPEPWS